MRGSLFKPFKGGFLKNMSDTGNDLYAFAVHMVDSYAIRVGDTIAAQCSFSFYVYAHRLNCSYGICMLDVLQPSAAK